MRGSTGRKLAALLGGVVLAGAACGTTTSAGAPAADEQVSDELVATMQVETGAEAVQLTLHVTNTGREPIELEFSSGQRYDFSVARISGSDVGETLWTWSADKSFMQALGSETLPPGGSLRYSADWPSAGQRGEFLAIGQVTSTNEPVRQSARFELGDE